MTLHDDFEESLSAPPLGQRNLHSFLEAIFSTLVGFIISWLTFIFIVSPLFKLRTSSGEDFLITCIFTFASIVRGYGVRRFFNWLHTREGCRL